MILLIPVVLVGLLLLFNSSATQKAVEVTTMDPANLSNYLRANLPPHLSQFADAFTDAANRYAALGLTPQDFALLHAGVIQRESFYSDGGYALRPRGPEGTGDPSNRWYDSEAIPKWADDMELVTGGSRYTNDGKLQIEVKPPAFAGAKVAGWGYGLGQIDFVSFKDWLSSNDWADPTANLNKSAEILSQYMERAGSVRYGVAAYNCGVAKALNAKGRGIDPDVFTTGGNYSRAVIASAVTFGFYNSEAA